MSLFSHNEVSGIIVDSAVAIHKRLGPGLLESVYQAILAHELRKRGLLVKTEIDIPVRWDGLEFEVGFRADMLVEDLVLVELKSVEQVNDVHKKQLLTYLRLSGKKLGLLVNFGAALLKDGITRIANGLEEG